MAERLFELLRQKVAGIGEAQHQHPFVRGIGDGTLGLERFQFWLRQDYVFLIEYARLLGLAATCSSSSMHVFWVWPPHAARTWRRWSASPGCSRKRWKPR